MSVAKVYELTGIDPWFLDNLHEILETEEALRKSVGRGLGNAAGSGLLRTAKRQGFSDRQLSRIFGTSESEIRAEHNFEDIVGKSAALRKVLDQVAIVAPTGSTVLLHGETGDRPHKQLLKRPFRVDLKLQIEASAGEVADQLVCGLQ